MFGTASARRADPSTECLKTDRNPTVYWLALLLILVVLNLLRDPQRLILPTLRVEDGTHVFAYFYENRHIREIFRFKAGYVPLVANIIGYCSVRLPTRLIPYGLTWFPLVLSVIASSIVFSKPYATWIPSRVVRGMICMLFVLSPLANTNLRAHTDYSIWSTLFMLILLLAHPLPQRSLPKYVCLGVINILIWSHPLTIVVFPFVVLFFFQNRRDRVLYGLTAFNLLVHQIVGVESSRLFAGMSLLDALAKLARSSLWTVVVEAQTAFAAAFGTALFDYANEEMWYLFVLWGLFLLLALVLSFRELRHMRKPILFSLYYISVLTFTSIVGRGYDTAGLIVGGKRYVHIQGLLFLLIYGLLGYCLGVGVVRRWLSGSRLRASTVFNKAVAAIPVGLLLCHHLILGYDVGDPPSHAVENGLIVRRFFNDLAELEKSQGSHRGIYLVAEKKDDWPIVIDTR
jgi:hypothetical protein